MIGTLKVHHNRVNGEPGRTSPLKRLIYDFVISEGTCFAMKAIFTFYAKLRLGLALLGFVTFRINSTSLQRGLL